MTAATESQQVTQSRIGKKPIPLPKGVDVKFAGRKVTVKGPKGELSRELPEGIKVTIDGGELVIEPAAGAGKRGRQFQGLTRALLASMVNGTANGYALSLDLYGVGYRAEVKGSEVTLALGLSHQVKYSMHPSVAGRVEIIDEA